MIRLLFDHKSRRSPAGFPAASWGSGCVQPLRWRGSLRNSFSPARKRCRKIWISSSVPWNEVCRLFLRRGFPIGSPTNDSWNREYMGIWWYCIGFGVNLWYFQSSPTSAGDKMNWIRPSEESETRWAAGFGRLVMTRDEYLSLPVWERWNQMISDLWVSLKACLSWLCPDLRWGMLRHSSHSHSSILSLSLSPSFSSKNHTAKFTVA